MITLPTNHPYFFTCPSCGCKLISVSTGNRAKPLCPKCDYSADDAFEYKLTSQGKTFVKIDRWYPSSKTCSVCGLIKDDLTLADRSWTCSGCGTTHNRDHNAAINIRNVGLLGLYPA